MKYITLIIFALTLLSCQKEPLDCTQRVQCWHHVYTSFRVCPDPTNPNNHLITDITSDTLYEEVSICKVEDWVLDTRDLDYKFSMQGDSIDLKFRKDHKNTCGCN